MNFICDEPVKQQCRTCRIWYPQQVFFRKNPRRKRVAHICATEYRPVCMACETTARTERKSAEPWLAKARSTIQRHAKRYGKTTKEFIRLYGWDNRRVAHILKHAFDNTCPYCRDPYANMPNSQWQVTMDILDPQKEPFLETNTQPCCQTCNREKSNTSPELWARKLRCWADWERGRLTRKPEPQQLGFGFI
jgi:hypothetical protein